MTEAQRAWQVIWCHERCYKPECKKPRCELASIVRQAGGSLLCMKKSQQFTMWLATKQKPAYFLVADWRETKPCIDALEEADATHWPFRVIVLCDTPKQFKKASHWAECYSHALMYDVHVCSSSDPFLSLFAALAGPPPELRVRLPFKNEDEEKPGASQIPML